MRDEVGNTRRLVASSSAAEGNERLDLLVHALAQLSDNVTLDLWLPGGRGGNVSLLASAYGVNDRIRLCTTRPDLDGAQLIYPSLENRRRAPLRSKDAPQLPLTLILGKRNAAKDEAATMGELVERLTAPGDPPAAIRKEDEFFRGHRIAFVTNLPTHYRVPLFAGIAERLSAAGASFRVFFLSRGSRGRPWLTSDSPLPFAHEFVLSADIPVGDRRRLIPVDLERRLDRFRPSMVLSPGFSPFVSGRVAHYGQSRRIPFGLWTGDHRDTATARSHARRGIRRWIAQRATFAVTYGSASAEYLWELRSSLPAIYGRNTSSVAGTRTRAADPAVVNVLAVGDLASPRKGIDVLVNALALVPALPCQLTVIGGGAELGELTERARNDKRIRFVGAVPPKKVADAYGQADVFAFPSRADVFGLAPVEAMASGLATIISEAPGAVPDLFVDGHNSIIVRTHRASDWAEALSRAVLKEELRAVYARRGRETIERRWTMRHAVDAWIAALRLGVVAPRQTQLSGRGAGR